MVGGKLKKKNKNSKRRTSLSLSLPLSLSLSVCVCVSENMDGDCATMPPCHRTTFFLPTQPAIVLVHYLLYGYGNR